MLKRLFTACFIVAVLSCTSEKGNICKTIPYTNDILSGLVPGAGLLGNNTVAEKNRILYIFGDSASCAVMRDTLLSVDRFDNASGAPHKDMLPDFAGETVACVYDSSSFRCCDLLTAGDTVGVKTQAINMLLASVDTVTHLSLYDKDGLGRKLPAKILIFTDPWVSLFGKSDIDTLIVRTSCPVSVLVPVECAFEKVLDGRVEAPSLAVVSDADSSSFLLYTQLFEKLCAERSLSGGSCAVFAAGDTLDLRRYMESYLETAGGPALNAMILDCDNTDIHLMKDEHRLMTSVMHEEYIRYGQLFAGDFKFVSALNCAVECCHSVMRSRNVFSHNISEPVSLHYRMVDALNEKSSISIVECTR